MKYPEEVLTKSRKGKIEVRSLIDKGKFIRYNYKDPETGKILEKGKLSLIIKNTKGKTEHYYMIPIKGNRYLAIPIKDKKKRKVWNSKKAIKLF
ncbi:MAG: hypothetical protein J7K26_00910 [Candidatus Aenigmarchaeota archaeon]|nr:hypothetical protein [Candidatus Aenigmarchaeota archaeon]